MGRYTGKRCRLLSMFGLTGSFFLVEIVVGYVTNSMALVADSFHMLSDIAALVIAFISVKMAPKSWSKVRCCWFNLSSDSISFHLVQFLPDSGIDSTFLGS